MEKSNKSENEIYIHERNCYLKNKYQIYTMELEKDVIYNYNQFYFAVGNKLLCGYCDGTTTKKKNSMKSHLKCHNVRTNKVFRCKICGWNSSAKSQSAQSSTKQLGCRFKGIHPRIF